MRYLFSSPLFELQALSLEKKATRSVLSLGGEFAVMPSFIVFLFDTPAEKTGNPLRKKKTMIRTLLSSPQLLPSPAERLISTSSGLLRIQVGFTPVSPTQRSSLSLSVRA